ncbi:MAG: hypothetical protein ACQRW7_07750 [Caulobacterales bacterium]|uniref:hypothetical protein n=1 Tax=Glycocaulis sp. TaxID=1969725 RepID=UPI003FA058B9
MEKKAFTIMAVVAGLLGLTVWYFADGQFMLAKGAVAEALRDPSSAQFRNLRRLPSGGVCGEVNARNAYGAYGGYKGFYYSGSEYGPGYVSFSDSGVELFRQQYRQHCSRQNT